MDKIKNQPTLKSVQRQFKYWRQHRKLKNSIPQKLWNRAVKLTENYSIHKVANALRLSYVTLSERVVAPIQQKSGFIELDLRNKIESRIKTDGEVEFEDASGWKMRIRGNSMKELIEAAKEIWKERI